MKKRLAFLLASLMLTGTCFAGCVDSSDDDEVIIDDTKTQLFVASYDGGIGNEWLDLIRKSFEEKYKDTSFEEGKKGVQLILDKSKADHASAIETSTYNVIFSEGTAINTLAATGGILDITDIVKEVNEDGKTIESKLTAHQQAALTAVNDKYYALPHYEFYAGVTYDKDLFNQRRLYIQQGGGYTNEEGNRSAGPDGKANTYDDGLPATYEEFFALCEQMVAVGVTPFIHNGTNVEYVDMLVENLYATYHGKEQMQLAFSFDSSQGGTLSGEDLIKADVITGWNGDTPIIEQKVITSETGYYTSQLAGKYYGLSFLETLMKNKDRYFSDKIKSALSHLDAQEEFIMSNLEQAPIAMLIEGTFWNNEAEGAQERAEAFYGETAENRNFAWMPLPGHVSGTVTETNGKSSVLIDDSGSYVIINANIADNENLVKLAKTFVKYCYTDANLEQFTSTNGVYKGVKYTISEETYDQLTKYQQSITDIRGDGSNVLYPISDNKIFVNAQTAFLFRFGNTFKTIVNGREYKTVYSSIGNGVSAKAHFEGTKVTETTWNTLYSKYFN